MDVTIIKEPVFAPRHKNSHKGTYGTAVFVCGSYGMAGAVVLSVKASLRSGLGIAKVIIPDKIYNIVARQVPEAVFVPLKTSGEGTFCREDIPKICENISNADAVLVGCGMGVSDGNRAVLNAIVKNAKSPLIIDADGINMLAESIDIIKQASAPIVLTPHPGEMSRLIGKAVAEVEDDRIGVAETFSKKHGVITVLKGSETLVVTDRGIYKNVIGNPGMATGGSGDTLAGILAAFLARERDIDLAVTSAVYVHSAAGDMAAQKLSQTAMLPSDLIEQLPSLFKKLEG